MDNDDNVLFRQSYCDKPTLSILKTIIFDGERVAIEDANRVCKINGVFAQICSPFILVPLITFHNLSEQSYCNYKM